MVALLGLSSREAGALPVLLTEGSQTGGERRYPLPAADSVNIDRAALAVVELIESQCERQSRWSRVADVDRTVVRIAIQLNVCEIQARSEDVTGPIYRE